MPEIVLSLVIFGVAVYLFIMTNRRIKTVKDSIHANEAKAEIEALIAEFNRAAVRNIELLEERIQTLNDTIQKANHKIVQMEDRIDRSNKPIVVEKRIEMPAMKAQSMIEKRPEKRKIEKEPPLPEPQATQAAETVGREVAETVSKAKTPVSEPAVRMASQDAGLSRADKLKAMIQEGRTKQELIELGFLENEINLFLFLVKKDD